MTTFTVSGTVATQQNLASGEIGFVTRNGSVLLPIGIGVIMGGSSNLMVMGTVGVNSVGVLGQSLSGAFVTVGESGMIFGSSGAAFSASVTGKLSLANAGQMSGAGGITIGLQSAAAAVTMVNSGVITGVGDGEGLRITASTTGSTFRLDNSGTMSTAGAGVAGLDMKGTGSAWVTNSGTISAADGLGVNMTTALVLKNSGDILGGVTVTGRADITNSGQILGNVTLGLSADKVRVSGLVEGFISLGAGDNDFYLSGGWVTGVVQGGNGSDIYYIDRSDIDIRDGFGGFDTVISTASFRLTTGIEELDLIGPLGLRGTGAGLGETILGDVGDDTLIGLAGNDYLSAEEGDNWLNGGAGNDTLAARDGDDLLDGKAGDDLLYIGAGADTIRGGLGVDTVRIDLAVIPGVPTKVNLATGTATVDGISTVKFSGIENVSGGFGDDSLTGDAGANLIKGSSGDDSLQGGGGADTLMGESGADQMAGGIGADVFAFALTAQSVAASGIDLITGFAVGSDRIDLSVIDATFGGADDAFVFVGTAAFAGIGPQLRYAQDVGAGTTTVEAQLANAGVVSMTLVLDGLITLTATDFAL